jgi:hypothetical protein
VDEQENASDALSAPLFAEQDELLREAHHFIAKLVTVAGLKHR